MSKLNIRIRDLQNDDIGAVTGLIRDGLCEYIPIALKKQLTENLKLQGAIIAISFLTVCFFGGDFITLIITYTATTSLFAAAGWLLLAYFVRYEETCDLVRPKIKTYWRFWVAELCDENRSIVIGTLAARRSGANSMELKRMSVHRTYRRHRVATQLLDHAIAHASQANFEEIFLTYSEIQEQAGRLYAKHGFRERKTLQMDLYFGLFSFKVYELVRECGLKLE